MMFVGNKKYIFLSIILLLWGGILVYLDHRNTAVAATPIAVSDTFSRQSEDLSQKGGEDDIQLSPHEERESQEISICGEFPCMSSQDFLDIFNMFEQEAGLSFVNKYIYQIPEVDDYLRAFAETRGYQKRGFADETKIVAFENIRTYPEVRDAYIKMRNEMVKQNIRLHFVSGYRSSTHQRTLVKNKLTGLNIMTIPSGIHDQFIDMVLKVSALPGYSKHHTGYATDFGCGNDYLVYTFSETECYAWLSYNNFENAKRFGFIPSYPEGIAIQGPDPEPWEFVWVGVDRLKNFTPKSIEILEESLLSIPETVE